MLFHADYKGCASHNVYSISVEGSEIDLTQKFPVTYLHDDKDKNLWIIEILDIIGDDYIYLYETMFFNIDNNYFVYNVKKAEDMSYDDFFNSFLKVFTEIKNLLTYESFLVDVFLTVMSPTIGETTTDFLGSVTIEREYNLDDILNELGDSTLTKEIEQALVADYFEQV